MYIFAQYIYTYFTPLNICVCLYGNVNKVNSQAMNRVYEWKCHPYLLLPQS